MRYEALLEHNIPTVFARRRPGSAALWTLALLVVVALLTVLPPVRAWFWGSAQVSRGGLLLLVAGLLAAFAVIVRAAVAARRATSHEPAEETWDEERADVVDGAADDVLEDEETAHDGPAGYGEAWDAALVRHEDRVLTQTEEAPDSAPAGTAGRSWERWQSGLAQDPGQAEELDIEAPVQSRRPAPANPPGAQAAAARASRGSMTAAGGARRPAVQAAVAGAPTVTRRLLATPPPAAARTGARDVPAVQELPVRPTKPVAPAQAPVSDSTVRWTALLEGALSVLLDRNDQLVSLDGLIHEMRLQKADPRMKLLLARQLADAERARVVRIVRNTPAMPYYSLTHEGRRWAHGRLASEKLRRMAERMRV